MTCIVGLIDRDGMIWMGGDSACLMGWDLTRLADPKVYRNGPFLIGSTGSTRLMDLLHYALVPPPLPTDAADLRRYMATSFITALRECFTAGGFTQKESEREQHGGGILVGVAGHLFHIDSIYSVTEAVTPYAACGCGESFALGVLFATEDQPAEQRISQALHAAEAFSGGVRGPFTIYGLDPMAVS